MKARNNSTLFINYKLKDRRPSILTLEDPKTGKQSEFVADQTIADTGKHLIRSFKNRTGDSVIVKSPSENIKANTFSSKEAFDKECKVRESCISDEGTLSQRAYPHDSPTTVITYLSDKEWTFRYIMPFISGQHLLEFVTKITTPEALLTFLLAITLELKSLHEKRVIHGDIYHNNVFAKFTPAYQNKHNLGISVHFIDFDSAYSTRSNHAIYTRDENENAKRWAPERRIKIDQPIPKPDVKHDIYSLGYTLLDLLRKSENFDHEKFKLQFPTLFLCVGKMQHNNPEERPSLQQFIELVNTELASLKNTKDKRKNALTSR